MPAQRETIPSATFNPAAAFFEHARRSPERLALSLDGVEWSYGRLRDLSARIAGWLRARRVTRGGRVGILGARHPLAYAGILGTCAAGASYVPLNPRNPRARTLELLRRAELEALIVDEAGLAALADNLAGAAPSNVLAPARTALGSDVTGADELASIEPLAEVEPLAPGDVAYLMFTSGTTGVPKGVMVTAANLRHFVRHVVDRYRFTPDDRLSQYFELTFDLSVFDLFVALACGASAHVVPEAQRLMPLTFVREHALTSWFAVPSTIPFLTRVKALAPGSLPSLRLSLFCGEALPASAAVAWRAATPNAVVENLYGPTEATVACLAEPCGVPLRVTPNRGCVAIGLPFDGTHAALVDEERRFLARGETGELALCGEQVAAGYWRDDELTRLRFPVLEHPDLGRRVFYLTRDLAWQDAEGHFHFLGRSDNQVKIHGYRVELEELDAQLVAHGGGAAAAVAWPKRDGIAEGIVAFVTGERPVNELREALARVLPWYMLPRRFVKLETLIYTSNGKVDRSALARRLDAQA